MIWIRVEPTAHGDDKARASIAGRALFSLAMSSSAISIDTV